MSSENQTWTKKLYQNFEGFVEGVIYDRDLSISARLFGLFLSPFSHLFSMSLNATLESLDSHAIINEFLPCLIHKTIHTQKI